MSAVLWLGCCSACALSGPGPGAAVHWDHPWRMLQAAATTREQSPGPVEPREPAVARSGLASNTAELQAASSRGSAAALAPFLMASLPLLSLPCSWPPLLPYTVAACAGPRRRACGSCRRRRSGRRRRSLRGGDARQATERPEQAPATSARSHSRLLSLPLLAGLLWTSASIPAARSARPSLPACVPPAKPCKPAFVLPGQLSERRVAEVLQQVSITCLRQPRLRQVEED